jgi:DNA methylase
MKKNNKKEFKPICDPIEPVKQSAKRHYGTHPYFTKRPYNVVQEYIRNFTIAGDVVLDPFTGSGITNVEALVLKRKTIGVDLSPLACFLTEVSCISPVDIDSLMSSYKSIEDKVGGIINKIDMMEEKDVEEISITEWYPKGIKLDFPRFCRHLLTSTRSSFKVIGAQLPERAMTPASVVEDLDIIKDI